MPGFSVSRSLRNIGTIPTVFLGTPPNYTEFESDGTMEMHGNATTWRDELGPLLGSRLESPASDVVLNLANASVTFEDSARYPTDYIVIPLQLNHDWAVQTLCEFHLHFEQANAELPNWLVEYRWQINGQTKTAGWTLLPLTHAVFTYSAGTLIQIVDGAASITPPATAELSDIFQVRLYRDYTNVSGLFSGVETSGLDVEALYADMHRQSNTIGSRQEYVK